MDDVTDKLAKAGAMLKISEEIVRADGKGTPHVHVLGFDEQAEAFRDLTMVTYMKGQDPDFDPKKVYALLFTGDGKPLNDDDGLPVMASLPVTTVHVTDYMLDPDKAISQTKAAELAGVSRQTIWRAMQKGDLEVTMAGGDLPRLTEKNVRDWIRARSRKPGER